MKQLKREHILTAALLLAVLVGAFVLDATLPSYHIAIKVVKKACVYSVMSLQGSSSHSMRK